MTHTHSYECNHRNGILLRTRHDEEGNPIFPEGAAPQFNDPYQQVRQSLRVAVNQLQDEFANRQNRRPPQRPLLLPNEIGILPRGQIYHFWPGCNFMQRARSSAEGRVYRECRHCVNMARQVEVTAIPFMFEDPQPGPDHQPEFEELAVPLDERHFPALQQGNVAIEEMRVG